MRHARPLPLIALFVCLAAASAIGCSFLTSGRNREPDLAGVYEFRESLIGSKHGPEVLVLNADKTYVQFYASTVSGTAYTNKGSWKFVEADTSSYITFTDLRSWGLDLWGVGPTSLDYKGDASLNVETWHDTLRLVINEDAGQYFVKLK